jgi:hypothetical protein
MTNSELKAKVMTLGNKLAPPDELRPMGRLRAGVDYRQGRGPGSGRQGCNLRDPPGSPQAACPVCPGSGQGRIGPGAGESR